MSETKQIPIPKEKQWELVYLLRRIENTVEPSVNIERLWRFCARHQISSEFLLSFMNKTMLYPQRILNALEQNEAAKTATPDEKKICVVTCVNNDRQYEECLLYLRHALLPKDFAVEYVPIYGAKSLAAGYQEGMRSSSAKYKVYIHQDACLIYSSALYRMIELFRAHPEIGMFGFAGCTKLPSSGVWYETEGIGYGMVAQATEPDTLCLNGYAKMEREYEPVEAIDGVFMMTQYDLHWRDDLFTGWDFYDISQSMEFRRHGWQVAVPKADTIWCVHDSDIDFDTVAYEHWRKRFVETYSDML